MQGGAGRGQLCLSKQPGASLDWPGCRRLEAVGRGMSAAKDQGHSMHRRRASPSSLVHAERCSWEPAQAPRPSDSRCSHTGTSPECDHRQSAVSTASQGSRQRRLCADGADVGFLTLTSPKCPNHSHNEPVACSYPSALGRGIRKAYSYCQTLPTPNTTTDVSCEYCSYTEA